MGMRLLVVDDEALILELFRRIVEPLGYEVLGISDSREAARLIGTEKYDGIVLDAVMPDLDGFALTQRIRASQSNHSVPIILCTGYDSVEMMRRGFQAGITFFLSKPVTPEKLRSLFRAVRGTMMQERRRYVRLPLKTVVSCQWAGKRFEAQSIDVGRGGITLECAGGIDSGQIVDLKFSLPGPNLPLKLMGKVTAVEVPNCLAVEFIDPEDGEMEALDRFVMTGTGE